jgi:superfamily II DNA or RNA helicase
VARLAINRPRVAVAIAPGFSEGPVPHVRLFTEKILVSGNRTESGRDEELTLPVLSLSFDYGATLIAASDERDRFFVSQGSGVVSVERDFDRESAARAELERLGAVELGCLDGYEESFGSPANYLVSVDGDVHTYCAFTAQALPELRAKGFNVEVDPAYPYRVQEGEAPWYVDVSPLEDRPDWFNCELGVELDGERINLLEALLGLLDTVPDDEALSRLSRRSLKFFAVPIDEQRYVRVPRDLLWDFFEVLRELYSVRRTEPGNICRYQGASVEALADAIERHHEPLRRYGASLTSAASEPATRPAEVKNALGAAGLKATLRGYQELGVAWLQQLRAAGVGGILADDMGLGKTLQTIAHLCIEHGRSEVKKPTLVVVPTSLIQNWRRELERFAPHLKVAIWHGNTRHDQVLALASADIIVTSYSLLARERERWAEREYHYIILDEAQAIKNPRAAAREAARNIQADHRLCLSGTPVENHLGDLWSLFDFLMPGLLGSAAAFHTGYRTPIEQDRNEAQMQALRRTVTPFILRRTKDEVATDLPPKTLLVRPVRLRGDQRQLYESIRVAAHADVRRVVRTKGMAGSTIAILDALMKLRQVCCDPRLVRVTSARRVVESAKLEFFFSMLTEQLAERRRILVFSQFTSMLGLIGEGLAQRGIRYLLLTGGTVDRQAKVDAFQAGEADVFLISLKAGGTGLNLTSADTVIHYDPWWNPAAQAQATDRAHRIGQTRPVFVHQLIVAGSVEERMLELQRHKQELASNLVGSGTQRTAFSESDLSDLFAPLES